MNALICPMKQGINELRKAVKFIHRKNRIKDFEEYRKQTSENDVNKIIIKYYHERSIAQ